MHEDVKGKFINLCVGYYHYHLTEEWQPRVLHQTPQRQRGLLKKIGALWMSGYIRYSVITSENKIKIDL